MKSLEHIYIQHNLKRRGHTEIKEIRRAFFKKEVGTGKKVLDIGCRDGALTSAFLEENEVIGLDVDTESLKQCPFETRFCDLNGDWDESGYDVVVMGEVLEHLYFPQNILIEAMRSLKPGGKLVGTVPNAFAWRFKIKYLLGRKDRTPMSDPTHINHFTKKELQSYLDKVFVEARVWEINWTTLAFTAQKHD